MGTDMTTNIAQDGDVASTSEELPPLDGPPVLSIPWLDQATSAGVTDIVHSLASQHREAYAVILFGSVARHEERPLDDPEPSDVDLLLIVDWALLNPATPESTSAQDLALVHTIGEADYRHQSPREIKFIFAARDLEGCDELFLENVAHDGILLWARGPLPAPLAAIAERDPLTFRSAAAH